MERKYQLKKPKGLDEWLIWNFADAHALYNKKENYAYCQKCGEILDPSRMKHGQGYVCKYCESMGYTLSEGMSRKKYGHRMRVLWFTRKGKTAYAEFDEVYINYTDPKITLDYFPLQQFRYGEKDIKSLYICRYGGEEAIRTKPNLIRQNSLAYYKVPEVTCPINLEDLQKTSLKYAELHKHGHTTSVCLYRGADEIEYEPESVIQYLNLLRRWPSVEMLCKSGFEDIVRQRIVGSTGTDINWRGKNLKKILKLDNMNDVRFAREYAKSTSQLNDIKWLRREGIKLTPATLHVFRNQDKELYKELSEIDNPIRLAEYIYKSNGRAREYLDYIDTVNKLGYQINKKVLYPDNLMEAHDDAFNKLKIIFTKNKTNLFKKTEKEIITNEYENEFIIRAAKSPNELIEESKALNHCVKTYIDKVARGESAIAFVRKIESPNESYFTVEVDLKRKLKQIRGKSNCSAPPEVMNAVNKWIASMA